MKDPGANRIFCCGFFRTGTKSLIAALKRLGYEAGQAMTMRDLFSLQCSTDFPVAFF